MARLLLLCERNLHLHFVDQVRGEKHVAEIEFVHDSSVNPGRADVPAPECYEWRRMYLSPPTSPTALAMPLSPIERAKPREAFWPTRNSRSFFRKRSMCIPSLHLVSAR